MYPSYKTQYLPSMSLDQIEALSDKDKAIVIVNTGAIEQHGFHLPLGTDSYLGQAWLNLTLPKIATGVPVYVAPPVTIARSPEHINFPGTLTLSMPSFLKVLMNSAEQVKLWGFRRLLFLNSHGGNISAIQCALPTIREELGLEVEMFAWYPRPEEPTDKYDIHAGEIETAWMYACAKELVKADRVVDEVPPHCNPKNKLQQAGKPACFAWMSSDLSESGILGYASRATREKGVTWMEKASADLAKKVENAFSG